MDITIIMVNSVKCPTCDAEEMHPDGDKLLIRAWKVQTNDGHWWSQCLVCAGFYTPDLSLYDQTAGDLDKGWF